MSDFAWIMIMVSVVVIAGCAVAVAGALSGPKADSKKAMAHALTEHTAVTATLSDRLDAIDARLASIEKTLTDIP
jgi:hypothetical protein